MEVVAAVVVVELTFYLRPSDPFKGWRRAEISVMLDWYDATDGHWQRTDSQQPQQPQPQPQQLIIRSPETRNRNEGRPTSRRAVKDAHNDSGIRIKTD